MKKIKRISGKILYSFARHLPVSYSGIQIGQTPLRAFCGRLMLEKCGKNVNIEQGARFSSAVELGDNSAIGVNARLTGKIIIGENVMMGPEVSIYVKNHAFSRTDIPMNAQGFTEEKPVYISDDVWIGERVIILPGVHVGRGAVVGAGAIVTKDVPEYAVVGGNPAKVIKMRK